MKSNEPLIQIKNMTKSFDKQVILKDINLEIYKGEVVSILGPSGCGKSTLLRSMNLLEKPDCGEIIFEGENLLDKSVSVDKVRQKSVWSFSSLTFFLI